MKLQGNVANNFLPLDNNMKCNNCGTVIRNGSVFCPKCGTARDINPKNINDIKLALDCALPSLEVSYNSAKTIKETGAAFEAYEVAADFYKKEFKKNKTPYKIALIMIVCGAGIFGIGCLLKGSASKIQTTILTIGVMSVLIGVGIAFFSATTLGGYEKYIKRIIGMVNETISKLPVVEDMPKGIVFKNAYKNYTKQIDEYYNKALQVYEKDMKGKLLIYDQVMTKENILKNILPEENINAPDVRYISEVLNSNQAHDISGALILLKKHHIEVEEQRKLAVQQVKEKIKQQQAEFIQEVKEYQQNERERFNQQINEQQQKQKEHNRQKAALNYQSAASSLALAKQYNNASDIARYEAEVARYKADMERYR